MARHLRRAVWPVVWALALGYFFVRGPMRALDEGGNLDFEVVYNGLQTFQEGFDPYSTEDVLAVAEAHERHYYMRHYANARLLYSPSFLSLFGPIAWLEYDTAQLVWLLLQLAAFVGLLQASDALARLEGARWQALLAAGLCFAPVHTNIAHGQPGIFFALFAVAFFLFLERDRPWPAAIAFSLLLGKPSFAVPAAVAGLIRGGWKPIGAGCLLAALTATPYLARYGPVQAVENYSAAIIDVQSSGGDADDSRQNPERFDMLNLRSWLSSWGLPEVVRDGTYALGLLAAVVALYRSRADPTYWTLTSTVSLLATYHRFHDASVMLVAVAAALRLRSWPLGACLAVFAVPGGAALAQTLGPDAPGWLEALIIRHQTLALIAVAALSLHASRPSREPGARATG